MEKIRGEGGKHVMKYGPESLSNWTRAVVTAAGLSGGAPPASPERQGGWTAQARPGLHGMPDYLDPRIAHCTVTPFANGC